MKVKLEESWCVKEWEEVLYDHNEIQDFLLLYCWCIALDWAWKRLIFAKHLIKVEKNRYFTMKLDMKNFFLSCQPKINKPQKQETQHVKQFLVPFALIHKSVTLFALNFKIKENLDDVTIRMRLDNKQTRVVLLWKLACMYT